MDGKEIYIPKEAKQAGAAAVLLFTAACNAETQTPSTEITGLTVTNATEAVHSWDQFTNQVNEGAIGDPILCATNPDDETGTQLQSFHPVSESGSLDENLSYGFCNAPVTIDGKDEGFAIFLVEQNAEAQHTEAFILLLEGEGTGPEGIWAAGKVDEHGNVTNAGFQVLFDGSNFYIVRGETQGQLGINASASEGEQIAQSINRRLLRSNNNPTEPFSLTPTATPATTGTEEPTPATTGTEEPTLETPTPASATPTIETPEKTPRSTTETSVLHVGEASLTEPNTVSAENLPEYQQRVDTYYQESGITATNNAPFWRFDANFGQFQAENQPYEAYQHRADVNINQIIIGNIDGVGTVISLPYIFETDEGPVVGGLTFTIEDDQVAPFLEKLQSAIDSGQSRVELTLRASMSTEASDRPELANHNPVATLIFAEQNKQPDFISSSAPTEEDIPGLRTSLLLKMLATERSGPLYPAICEELLRRSGIGSLHPLQLIDAEVIDN